MERVVTGKASVVIVGSKLKATGVINKVGRGA